MSTNSFVRYKNFLVGFSFLDCGSGRTRFLIVSSAFDAVLIYELNFTKIFN